MTKITVNANMIEISGHAPEKVVCHGISAISQMVANYLERRNFAEIKREDGYLKIYNIISDAYPLREVEAVLEAFIEGLKDTAAEYPNNIIFIFE